MGKTDKEIMMFIDTSKCIGCRSCQVACKQWHSLPADTDSGEATGGSSTTLQDSAKNWAINEWKNLQVQILAGAGAGQKRTISSNTATTLTFSPSGAALDSSSDYAISTVFNGTYTNPPDMSGRTLTVVRFNESRGSQGFSPYFNWTGGNAVLGDDLDGPAGGTEFLFLKDQCRHCYQPKCKRGCPNGVYTTQEGFVLFGENCNDDSCRFRNQVTPNPQYILGSPDYEHRKYLTVPMTMADHCPYNIPRFSNSLERYVKCDFCYDRFNSNIAAKHKRVKTYSRIDRRYRERTVVTVPLTNQYTTACEFACPTGAIITGFNDEIIGYTGAWDGGMGNPDSLANQRYNEVIRTYPRANIYHGLWGRVHVIYLLVDEPEKYGLQTEAEPKLGVPGFTSF